MSEKLIYIKPGLYGINDNKVNSLCLSGSSANSAADCEGGSGVIVGPCVEGLVATGSCSLGGNAVGPNPGDCNVGTIVGDGSCVNGTGP